MVASNTYGRQTVIPLTNKSGGGVIAGDVVVIDTTNNDAFTTTTSAGFTGGIGIAQETIANNAIGRVLIGGYAPLVNVNASVTRGHYGATHTVAKQAADAGASRTTGTFCQFLTGGTTPDALMYPVDLAGVALTNPMTNVGDIIIGTTAGAPARLADVAVGSVLKSGGVNTAPAWGEVPTLLAVHQYAPGTLANYSLNSTTLTDVDATNMAVTFTAPASGNIVVVLSAYVDTNGAAGTAQWGLRESTSNLATSAGFIMSGSVSAGGYVSKRIYLTGVSGGSHTYKWSQASQGSGTVRTLVQDGAAGNFPPALMEVWSAP